MSCAGAALARPAAAQTALSRVEAFRLAAVNAPRSELARVDSLAAVATVRVARQFENPTLSASYSKSEPTAHFALDIPFDWPGLRAPRIAAASRMLDATSLRARYARAALELDVDTAYTRAAAAAARTTLSSRTARDADSLLSIARVRRDAGDASDLDVELARVFAGQSMNNAINDSVSAIAALATLQTLIGLPGDSTRISLSEPMVLSDSGARFASGASSASAMGPNVSANATMPVAVAQREMDAASLRLLVEQKRRIAAPALSVGFETGDPSSKGLLPTLGFALPLPLFNRNSASIQLAQADVARARASVALARLEQTAALSNAQREATAASARAARTQQLVASANRIAALSLIAYREGAAPLATVLDAQRTARESLAQYVEDVATASTTLSVLRFISLTPGSVPQ